MSMNQTELPAGAAGTAGRRSLVTVVFAITLAATAVFAAGLLWPAPASAQDNPPATPVATVPVTANDVNNVARELWCPLCSGVRLDNCELKACEQMREVIQLKLSQGESKQAIKDYFVDQYGPQVLGEPPKKGFNLLAWVLPILVLIGGGLFVVRQGQRMLRRTNQSPAPDPAQTKRAAENEYERKLQEELDRYD